MGKCEICKKESFTLLYANHKDLGMIKVCQNCWQELYTKNRLVSGFSGSGGGCCG